MKKCLLFLSILCLTLLFVGCSAERSGAGHSGGYVSEYSKIDSSKLVKPDSTEKIDIEEKYSQIQAGQLSAAAINDNEHYDFFISLTESGQTEKENGIYYSFNNTFNDPFKIMNRIKLTFDKENLPERVNVLDDSQNIIMSNKPLNNGELYLYLEKQDEYHLDIEYLEGTEIKHLYDTITSDKDYALETNHQKSTKLEIMFVIDTTGSMGDEISYLIAELNNVIIKVAEENPDAEIRVSILVYRDLQDDYVTKYSDFTTDIESQVSYLSKKSASGGGDFEEAVQIALDEASLKNWSSDSTKLIVFVADAPAHDKDLESWVEAVNNLNKQDIHIITVASSGIDRKTEYFFRCQSMITNGLYTFLTNDSGIGESHIEPNTEEEYTVEYLNSMLIRLISGYYSGTFKEPVSYVSENQQTIEE